MISYDFFIKGIKRSLETKVEIGQSIFEKEYSSIYLSLDQIDFFIESLRKVKDAILIGEEQ